MAKSLYDRIWRREAGGGSSSANIRGIYGSKEWVSDLDIVNELGGHTGCVNALRYVCDLASPRTFLVASASHFPPIVRGTDSSQLVAFWSTSRIRLG